ncbi:MAG: response regulator transcription factor [Anaerolineae bacterium]|nr:response regulator transcription factor [Anaerolineae bacterium]
MSSKLKVAILDDHPLIIDGYISALSKDSRIEVAAQGSYGEELSCMLKNCKIDLLILDVNVPTGKDNPNPYPIMHIIPTLLDDCPDLTIIVISMFDQRSLIKALLDAGAYGFILKDDHESFNKLADILLDVHNGDIYLSQSIHKSFNEKRNPNEKITIPRRQREILSICLSDPDIKTKEIANLLHIAHSTVRNQLSKIYVSLGVNSRFAAIQKARELGLLPPETSFPDAQNTGG